MADCGAADLSRGGMADPQPVRRRILRIRTRCRAWAILAAVAGAGSISAPATAQPAPNQPQPQARTEGAACPGLIAQRPNAPIAIIQRVALKPADVQITFVGHATFLIESPRGVTIATDYNDFVRPSVVPQIATMNRAHSTHYTLNPDPGIAHVLRGWGESPDKPARHDLTVADVRVRNVPTNIRRYDGATERHGNSIFVFEIAGLCIGHLGHLHHTLTAQQIDEIGRLDVALVPVDGSYTLDLDGMMEVLEQLRASLVIPMHFFGGTSLQRFLDRARERGFGVESAPAARISVSADALPARPTIRVLPGP